MNHREAESTVGRARPPNQGHSALLTLRVLLFRAKLATNGSDLALDER